PAARPGVTALTSPQLRALAAAGAELTVIGVPLGSGGRMGLDRDRDGYPDGDEIAAGRDPGDPASTPAFTGVTPDGATATGLRGARPNPFRGATTFELSLARDANVQLAIFDVMGREVRVLSPAGPLAAGVHRVAWDGR